MHLAEDIYARNNMSCNESQEEELDESTLLDILHLESNTGEFDLNDIMVSAVQDGKHKGVDEDHLVSRIQYSLIKGIPLIKGFLSLQLTSPKRVK